jgi:hypothetical protein
VDARAAHSGDARHVSTCRDLNHDARNHAYPVFGNFFQWHRCLGSPDAGGHDCRVFLEMSLSSGFSLPEKNYRPNLAKLNPISGLKKLISLRSLVELAKSIIKLLIISSVAYVVINRYLDQIPGLMQLSIGNIISFIGQVSFQICLYTHAWSSSSWLCLILPIPSGSTIRI